MSIENKVYKALIDKNIETSLFPHLISF